MCSTCNYKNYTLNEDRDGNYGKLEQSLGMGNLLIYCDDNGRNYKLAVKDQPKSAFTIYRCPTCGKVLY